MPVRIQRKKNKKNKKNLYELTISVPKDWIKTYICKTAATFCVQFLGQLLKRKKKQVQNPKINNPVMLE